MFDWPASTNTRSGRGGSAADAAAAMVTEAMVVSSMVVLSFPGWFRGRQCASSSIAPTQRMKYGTSAAAPA